MRLHVTIPLLAVLLAGAVVAAGCATAPNPLMGSWVVESYTGERPAPNAPAPDPAQRAVKILTRDRFAFGDQQGTEMFAGGGRYEWEEGVYRETVEYHWMPDLVGKTLEFDCRLDGDLWYHTGTFRFGGRDLVIREVWRRLDPASEGMRHAGTPGVSGDSGLWW